MTVRKYPLKGDLNPPWDPKSFKLQLSLRPHSRVTPGCLGLDADLQNFLAGVPPYFSFGTAIAHYVK